MYNIQDYSVLYKAIRPVIRESWYFTHICKALACLHYFTMYKGRFGSIKLVYPRHFLLKCLCQARKVSSHVLNFWAFTIFYWILKIFRQCGIFVFILVHSLKTLSIYRCVKHYLYTTVYRCVKHYLYIDV